MRQSELFSHLNIFFGLFQHNPVTEDIKKPFRLCLQGMNNRNNICDVLSSLKSVYDDAIRLTENEAAVKGYREDLLTLQRNLYRELEYLLAFEETDTRHHFLVVIPVADRPAMLSNCLESLIEQCRIFQYGGSTVHAPSMPVYNKISAVIIDDSKDADSILQIKDLCAETTLTGIRTCYVGLDEQTQLLKQIPSGYWELLQELLGGNRNPVPPHKGASISRNIAYLWLHAFLGEFREKALIYFLDSDEEFRIKVNGSNGIKDVFFINYFYRLDKLFDEQNIEVVTGKVVGDPPVSPSVMVKTFLEDSVLFLDTISAAASDKTCIFHSSQTSRDFSAEYHDMIQLFGYKEPLHPTLYSCGLSGDHTIKDCLDDFSKKTLAFFYGLHPTRTQYYFHGDDFSKTENARTVYTGNYVFRRTGLRNFIPFAGLKLRMAGPALGRILRKRLKQGFVSANLPLLHKRTMQTTYSNEFRSGIFREKNLIDISLEFNRQFWGDVMLFTLENLTELGYPDKRLGLPEITETAYDVQEKIWLLYKKRQDEIEAKTETIEQYLTDKGSWWNRGPGAEHALKNMGLFCSQIRNNFGGTSESMKKISGEIEEGASIAMIINAVHSFYEIDIAWNELLKSSLTVPLNCGTPAPLF